MQPKTKFQKKVVEVQKKLKPITEQQIRWGYDNCFENSGTITKHKAGCLECGHSWSQKANLLVTIGGCECPSCGKELKIELTAKRKHQKASYWAILTTIGEFQVVRVIYLTKYCKIGTVAHLSCTEVMQHWITAGGKSAVFSKSVNPMSLYYDNWILLSELELKGTMSQASNLRSSIIPNKIHPKRKVLPEIRRNGFKGNFHGISPANFFKVILQDSQFETLLKANQISMLSYYYSRYSYNDPITKYWKSIKICIRNNYIIKDAGTWVDYLNMLSFFNKDLLSSHYICPIDLKDSHDRLVKKHREVSKRRKLEQARRDLQDWQAEYEKQKGKSFGISFSEGEITVKVLETVEEFQKESELLRHCLFGSGYYKKEGSLCLSARIEDQPIETIEISLSTLTIVQARGRGNQATEHHEKIVNLVKNNLNKISRLIN
ncbi:PcfJ domain-containing protein [Dyadobacter sp. LHD-138]|uniref:PcfJ domain-containing protein n=1 Tax=Dyadobacter sp. LHD-138 TaxID=3071413 RepID=UPI0027DF1EA1|nr:PcfJ domain-containing protein [Dyadobacter sp. LHD-138]MDQ6477820.1 PcfJ domain-containing protein [Dyadobacter sp. LHD-138]